MKIAILYYSDFEKINYSAMQHYINVLVNLPFLWCICVICIFFSRICLSNCRFVFYFPESKKERGLFCDMPDCSFCILRPVYFRTSFLRCTDLDRSYELLQRSYMSFFDFLSKDPDTYMEFGVALIELIFAIGFFFWFSV